MYDLIKIPFARKQKDTVAILCVICLLFSWSCQTKNSDDETETFCSYINEENIDKTIPIVNQFLSGLSAELDGERQLQELAAWLKSCPCIIDAAVLTQSTPTSEIVVSFDENGTTKQFVMDVSMEKPLKIAGYRAYNQPIFNKNTFWSTLIYGIGAWDIICCVKTQYVYFEGDSTVSAVSYKKVFSCEDKFHENIKFEGLIREQDKKTYIIPTNSEKEYLLYDFSLEEGMTFEVQFSVFVRPYPITLYVSSVDFIEVNGSLKKRMQITEGPISDRIIDIWIEEIGSMSGILNPCYRFDWSGGVIELLCYYQNNELYYKNPVYSDCYYDKKEDIKILK